MLEALLECAIAGAGFWRLWDRLRTPPVKCLREWLLGFAVCGVLCVPFTWDRFWTNCRLGDGGTLGTLLRTLVFITLTAGLLSAACGIFAGQERRWWEALVWFAIALALPVKESLATWFVNPWLIVLVLALAAASTAGALFAARTRGITLLAAGVLPFLAFPVSGLVRPAEPADSPELRQLAAWAKASTDETAMFLFADEGMYGGSGAFRARALRSIYVDYEGRALVNYFPQFAGEWARRWRDVRVGTWQVGPQDFRELAGWHIDFVVLRKEHAIPSKQAEFSNSHYVVYRVLNTF